MATPVAMATSSSTSQRRTNAVIDSAVAKAHFRVAQYMMEAGIKLSLQSATVASACTIYYRFFSVCNVTDYDTHLVGAAAIYLATKVEEQPVKLRDIINVCYRSVVPRSLTQGYSFFVKPIMTNLGKNKYCCPVTGSTLK